jgi:hypothetical protein
VPKEERAPSPEVYKALPKKEYVPIKTERKNEKLPDITNPTLTKLFIETKNNAYNFDNLTKKSQRKLIGNDISKLFIPPECSEIDFKTKFCNELAIV